MASSSAAVAQPMTPTLRFRSEQRSHTGMVRARNEDALLVHPGCGVWAVADGMGGHDRGHYASALLVEMLAKALDDAPDAVRPSAAVQVVEAATARVHTLLGAEARRAGTGAMGTTLALALTAGELAVILWAGDSRVYHQRGDRFVLLTRDHAVPGGALSRAIGAGEDCTLDAVAARLAPRDRLLLCSDGLTKELADAEIAALLAEERGLLRCADRLMDAALRRRARDNVSFIVVEAL